MHFIKLNELELTQAELFSFLYFNSVAANVTELFCVAIQANIELFLQHSNLHHSSWTSNHQFELIKIN